MLSQTAWITTCVARILFRSSRFPGTATDNNKYMTKKTQNGHDRQQGTRTRFEKNIQNTIKVLLIFEGCLLKQWTLNKVLWCQTTSCAQSRAPPSNTCCMTKASPNYNHQLRSLLWLQRIMWRISKCPAVFRTLVCHTFVDGIIKSPLYHALFLSSVRKYPNMILAVLYRNVSKLKWYRFSDWNFVDVILYSNMLRHVQQ